MKLVFILRKPNKSRLLWMLLFLAFLKPGYFENVEWLDKLFDITRIITVIVLGYYNFIYKRKKSYLALFILAYSLIPLSSTIINGGDVFSALVLCAISFGATMIFDIVISEIPDLLFRTLLPVLEILIYINLLTIFIFPQGLYLFITEQGWISDQCWILGLRNAQTLYLMLGCVVELLNYITHKVKIKSIIRLITMYTVVWITISVLNIGSGILGFIAFGILSLILVIIKKNKLRLNFVFVSLFHIIMSLIITNMNTLSSYAIFVFIRGTGNTVFARSIIWSTVWDKIIQNPILGYGLQKSDNMRWLTSIAAGATTAHNTFLDILFRGGVSTFIVFIAILLIIGRRLKNSECPIQLYNWASVSLFTTFIIAQAEGAMSGGNFYLLIGLLWITPAFSKLINYQEEGRFETTRIDC